MRLRVLVVEDSEDDAKLLLRALAKAGFAVASQRVDTAAAMQAALDEGTWDVILADYSMPEFSAPAALDTLKDSGLDLPFIIVSGTIGEDLAVEAMKAGAHDYIMKDNLMRLVPAVRRELREATVRRERREADEALRLAYAELETRVAERTAELAKANEELRLHQEREIAALQELDRQKDEFLSVAAHELKTPITSLLGFAQILLQQQEKRRPVDPERSSRALSTIVRQAHKLTALVSQLLDISRLEGGGLTLERQCVDLVGIVGEVAAAARLGAAQREIDVQAPPRAEAFVDPLRIEQVVTNLVGNAIRYSPAGPIEISLAATEGAHEIAVRDHGIGIPPQHLPHIFERFYQAHSGRHTAGLGLGLYISSQIVALHGGRIQVESPPDGGSRFSVVLPTGACGPEA